MRRTVECKVSMPTVKKVARLHVGQEMVYTRSCARFMYSLGWAFPFLSLAEWDWQVLDVIPPSEDGKGQPGLAGAYAGIHNDCLIIAGGANFPMGRHGRGKKIYHQSIYALERVDEEYIWHSQSIKLPAPWLMGRR